MINIVAQRLPGATLDSWEQKRMGLLHPRFEDLQMLIESKARGRRALESDVESRENLKFEQTRRKDSRFRPYPENRAGHGTYRTEQGRQGQNNARERSDVCPVADCGQRHVLYKCDLFKKLPLNNRWEIVKGANLCRCCLRAGHVSRECNFQQCSYCPEATVKHNFRLCNKTVSTVAVAHSSTEKGREKKRS